MPRLDQLLHLISEFFRLLPALSPIGAGKEREGRIARRTISPLSSRLHGKWSRRSFLQAGLAAGALSGAPLRPLSAAKNAPLPSIPSSGDLAGAWLAHRWRDLYCSPTAQNELGYAQADKSVAGLTGIALPPFGCCGIPNVPFSPGFLLTCEIFLDGRILLACPGGDEIAYRWYPHQFVRAAQTGGLHFRTVTFLPAGLRAVAQSIQVTNRGHERRKFTLAFDLRAGVAQRTEPWFSSGTSLADNSGEADNRIDWDAERGCLVFSARHSQAVSVQGIAPGAARCQEARTIALDLDLGPGETRELHYANALAATADEALALYDRVQHGFDGLARENEQTFDRLVRSAFTPGNSDFSGYLPQLETDSEELWNLYHAGFRNLLFARCASPASAYGATYVTLGGRVHPTLSFPWDTSLTALSLSLLDPEALRRLMERWFAIDLHRCLATDYVSGQGVGPWYGVNDMAVVRCAREYLRVTGNFAWLNTVIEERKVLDHLAEHAGYWKRLDKDGHGLGDYGSVENLSEVISTYQHEVAGMNAGSVSSLRFVANLMERAGNSRRAAALRTEAMELARRINQKLYVEGKGWWRCGQPDGSFNEVRFCYDFLSVFDNMAEDLSETQMQEMSAFFWRELHSRYWMHALSPEDADATWNPRPDHSWLGAYAGWPPMSAKALYKTDPAARVAAWLKNLSKVVNQGPVGQAHFAETVFPLEHGAAYKCPTDAPYYNDWCCISGGAFTDLVIDTIFGANLTLYGGVHAVPRLEGFDPNARLTNLRHQGRNYMVSRTGASTA